MKNIIIIIPVYNDWQSLKKLLQDIDEIIATIKDTKFSGIIVNDASTISDKEITKPKNFTFLISDIAIPTSFFSFLAFIST